MFQVSKRTCEMGGGKGGHNLRANQDDQQQHLIEKRLHLLYKIKWEQERPEQECGLIAGAEESSFDKKYQIYVNERTLSSS